MISETHLGNTYDHLVSEERDNFRVHTSAYADPAVFEHGDAEHLREQLGVCGP